MTERTALKCWVNGEPTQTISVMDASLRYGDGLFETMAVRQGKILLEAYHLERLRKGCKQLGIAAPEALTLKRELAQAARDQSRAILNLVLTRGCAGFDGRPALEARTTRIVSLEPWPEYPTQWMETGIHVRICDTHFSRNRRLAGLKHLSRLDHVLARLEWTDADNIQEGLMLDEEGSVIGGTMSNVFAWLSHGVLATPALRTSGIEGVMRRYLLERAEKADIQLRVATISLTELMRAEEIFVCNSVIGVWPVAAVGAWKFKIGPITRQAQQWAQESG
ncbi:MAG: aminodeoxychorismate lyase [Gammaproteobacteria bacterium]